MSLLVCLLLLLLSPITPPLARKFLHIIVAAFILSVSAFGSTETSVSKLSVDPRTLICSIAGLVSVLSLPLDFIGGLHSSSPLASLWDRFDKTNKSFGAAASKAEPSETEAVEKIKNRVGIFFFSTLTLFVYYFYDLASAAYILVPMYFADPFAALSGQYFSHKQSADNIGLDPSLSLSSKTVIGSLGFSLCATLLLFLFEPNGVGQLETGLEQKLLRSAALGFNLGLIELLSGPLDNLFLPGAMIYYLGFDSLQKQKQGLVTDMEEVEACLVFSAYAVAMLLLYFSVFKANVASMLNAMSAFRRFSRPHTVIGTTLSTIVVTLVAVSTATRVNNLSSKMVLLQQQTMVVGIGVMLLAALQANIYIVGLNQLYDISIDKINKPYLPLASGEFSMSFGNAIVVLTGISSLLTSLAWTPTKDVTEGLNVSLFATVFVGNLLGTMYSVHLPFLHWKRFPILAAALIFMVRGGVVQIGFYVYASSLLGLGAEKQDVALSLPSWSEDSVIVFLCVFLTCFGAVIAGFKDVPDILGDEKEGIRTFAVRFGAPFVVSFLNVLLLLLYSAASVFWLYKATMPGYISALLHVVIYALLGLNLHKLSTLLYSHSNKKATEALTASDEELSAVRIRASYMNIWKAFYAEYLIIFVMVLLE